MIQMHMPKAKQVCVEEIDIVEKVTLELHLQGYAGLQPNAEGDEGPPRQREWHGGGPIGRVHFAPSQMGKVFPFLMYPGEKMETHLIRDRQVNENGIAMVGRMIPVEQQTARSIKHKAL